MLSTKIFLLALLPLAFSWPMDMGMGMEDEDDDKGSMMDYMMKDKMSEKDKMMMKYMMMMEKKEEMMKKPMTMEMMMMKKHYPGDEDGCKAEDEDSWKMWEQKKKMMEMKEQFDKFKGFLAYKKKQADKHAMEEKEKMYAMWEKHQELKDREAKEKDFEDMLENFQTQKHKFAFKLTHEFLALCQCAEITDTMGSMFGMMPGGGPDLMENMDQDDVNMTRAMENGEAMMLAKKLMKMGPEEKKKVFMSGLIKTMCSCAQEFVKHVKDFEERYMHGRGTTMTAPPTTTDPFSSP